MPGWDCAGGPVVVLNEGRGRVLEAKEWAAAFGLLELRLHQTRGGAKHFVLLEFGYWGAGKLGPPERAGLRQTDGGALIT